jgi:hypothetical protein
VTGHTPHPEVWTNFSGEKSSKDPGLRDRVVWTFVNLSIPANRTNRDVLEQIAKRAEIPIESLCDELDHPAYPRGQVIFGYAGDQIDRIATYYDQMRWWVSDTGLNMAIVNSAKSDAKRILDLVTLEADAQFSGSREPLKAMTERRTARRGRHPDIARKNTIRSVINKHGDDWRDHLGEILKELDSGNVDLGHFQRVEIDLGAGDTAVRKWEDLELTAGDQRRKIIDALRKYR